MSAGTEDNGLAARRAPFLARLTGPARIATALTAGNVLSLLLSFGGTFVLTLCFDVDLLGRLGFVSSLTMLCAPFITFRLDFAFERLARPLWSGLILAVHAYALAASLAIVAVFAGLSAASGAATTADAVYLGLNTFFFCSHSFIWSWLVARRALGLSIVLQLTRAVLSFALPALLLQILAPHDALMTGTVLSQATALAYLGATREGWTIRRARQAMTSVRRRQRHLFLGNSLPVFLNLLSVQGMQPLTFYVFGPAVAGVFWIVMRLVFVPATVFCDPIRRAAYARHPDLGRLTPAIVTSYAGLSWIGLAIGLAGSLTLFLAAPLWSVLLPAHYAVVFPGLYFAVAWVGATIGNAPTTGLIPTLRVVVLPTIAESLGILARGLAILAGLVGLAFADAFTAFYASILLINVAYGAVIRSTARRHLAPGSRPDNSSVSKRSR